jgi:Tfp pilus assembly protein PilF
MKKTTITILAAGMISVSVVKAQTIQEGMNHLYAGRAKAAVATFEKMLAVNPNSVDAHYWLGQSQLDLEEIAGARIVAARKVYEKALQTTNNAPLAMVGMGHVDLLENKVNDARQKFETALTMTRGKKGDDPIIETAIGRAIADSKTGDYQWAVRLLEDAATKDPRNTETLLQLGNAYRKAGEGSGGGQAFQTYKKALEANPNFAPASLRLSKLFESQKNWELVLQYLNESVQKDPKFSNGYYELFYYYFYRAKFPEAEEQLKKFIDSKLPENDIQDQYLYAQLCWARKDFECATQKGESVVSSMGSNTKPKVYRLLADAYFQKADYTSAKRFSDLFFEKKNPEDVILPDYEIKASVLSKAGGTPDDILKAYIDGSALDTTADAKVGFLKKGMAYFKEQKLRGYEARMGERLIEVKPKPIVNDYFDVALAYYFDKNYSKSLTTANAMLEKFPDQVYGYEWAYNNSIAIDTVKQDSIGVPSALKLHEFSEKDTAKYKKQYITTSKFLGAYYINKAKNKEKSLLYFNKWLQADPASSATIQPIIDQIKKMPAGGTKPPAKQPSGNSTPTKPAATPVKPATAKTITPKKAAAPVKKQ